MPILQSAIKKMRQDKKRTILNKSKKDVAKKQIKKYLRDKSQESFKKAISLIDKLAKKRVIHKNKAARLKAKLAKTLKQK